MDHNELTTKKNIEQWFFNDKDSPVTRIAFFPSGRSGAIVELTVKRVLRRDDEGVLIEVALFRRDRNFMMWEHAIPKWMKTFALAEVFAD